MLRRAGAAALVAGVIVAVPAGAAVSATPERAAFALLADDRLVRVGLASGEIRVRRLGAARRTIQSGPLLALGRDRSAVYALVGSQVVVVDAGTLAVRRRLRLPSGLTYRGLAVGPVSGRVYVSGNRAVRVLDRATGLAEEDATVTIVDPGTGAVAGRLLARAAAGRSWYVYWIALSPDERRVALGYHGGCGGNFDTCTTGADVLELRGGSLRPCAPVPPRSRGSACSPEVHGALVASGDGFFAASGGPPVLELDSRGRVVRRLATGMATHLMDLALDRGSRTVYAVGPCDKGGGLRAVDLRSGSVRRLRTARGSRAVCGSRVAVAPPATLVVPTGRSTAILRRIPEALLVLDARSGRTVRRVRVGARIADVAVG